jgi:2-keto-4-pentenoate hydratase/2-oxohepta-3-ene-1,7-dioic acid hydratase in catechol pathway
VKLITFRRSAHAATEAGLLQKDAVYPPFCPLGPCVVTADELTGPHSLDLRLTIDGEVMQRAKTRDLIFDIPTVLGHISAIVLLQPGDIVSTGTPHGVGLGATPQRWMRP